MTPATININEDANNAKLEKNRFDKLIDDCILLKFSFFNECHMLHFFISIYSKKARLGLHPQF